MKKFFSYIAEFDSQFLSRIRGAEQDQISMLEHLVGRRLPVDYRTYLETMGRDDGGFNFTVDGTTQIEEIIAYYQEDIVPNEWEPPADSIVIGVGAISLPDVGLLHAYEGEPKVAFVANKRVVELYAASLEGLLMRMAFERYRLRQGHRVFLTSSYESIGERHMLPHARELALRAGFKELGFSDEICFCGEKIDAAIGISQYKEQGLALTIASKTQGGLVALRADFVKTFGVEEGQLTP